MSVCVCVCVCVCRWGVGGMGSLAGKGRAQLGRGGLIAPRCVL